MHIHAFDLAIENPDKFRALITKLKDRLPLEYSIEAKIRLESFKQENNNLFFNFDKIRNGHAPGKAAAKAPIQGFEFKAGEELIEDSACLLDLDKNIVLIQYNHAGPRYKAIEYYFNELLNASKQNPEIQLKPKYDKEFYKKLINDSAMRKFELHINPANLEHFNLGDELGLSPILNLKDNTGSTKLTITLSIKHGESFQKNLLKKIETFFNSDDEDVLKNTKIAFEDDDHHVDNLISLIGKRIMYEDKNETLDQNKRVSFETRISILKNAYSSLAPQL